jgi:hypothetical protein
VHTTRVDDCAGRTTSHPLPTSTRLDCADIATQHFLVAYAPLVGPPRRTHPPPSPPPSSSTSSCPHHQQHRRRRTTEKTWSNLRPWLCDRQQLRGRSNGAAPAQAVRALRPSESIGSRAQLAVNGSRTTRTRPVPDAASAVHSQIGNHKLHLTPTNVDLSDVLRCASLASRSGHGHATRVDDCPDDATSRPLPTTTRLDCAGIATQQFLVAYPPSLVSSPRRTHPPPSRSPTSSTSTARIPGNTSSTSTCPHPTQHLVDQHLPASQATPRRPAPARIISTNVVCQHLPRRRTSDDVRSTDSGFALPPATIGSGAPRWRAGADNRRARTLARSLFLGDRRRRAGDLRPPAQAVRAPPRSESVGSSAQIAPRKSRTTRTRLWTRRPAAWTAWTG